MKKVYAFFIITLIAINAVAQSVSLPAPAGSVSFGTKITFLPNGNYVVTDPNWANGSLTDVGAVYLYNGKTDTLISTLTGTQASDQVGKDGIDVLSNGNYIIRSSYWNNGTAYLAGAVTWGSSTTGISGVVSSSNSLVGSQIQDIVGWDTKILPNGNYLVRSPYWNNGSVTDAGAVTWGNGTIGVSGVVSSSNSLVGSTDNDQIGLTRSQTDIILLPSGNFLLQSGKWDNGSLVDVGAVTWGNGAIGISGAISSSNSLVGVATNDKLGGIFGSNEVTVLTNGNYIVYNADINIGSDTSVGSATWGSGTTGVSGVISSSNSLVGSQTADRVGANGITVLSNGNYVVSSGFWHNGSVTGAGAATWANGTTGLTGTVTTANSLVGSNTDDGVGMAVALTNGNYVIRSPYWTGGSANHAGAVTWCNGTTGSTGIVSASNSLIGTLSNADYVGDVVTALTNGNYVVGSSQWGTSFSTPNRYGAFTWCNGTTGLTGSVSSANSMVGSNYMDYVGGSVKALPNGAYVVISTGWKNGSAANAGAVTWGNGTSAMVGLVTSSNSLVGSLANDKVGKGGITVLANGNYVVVSDYCANGSFALAGAVTWGSAATGISGVVSPTNSLMGGQAGCLLATGGASNGNKGIYPLPNGNYVVNTPYWKSGGLSDVGAVTWGNGATGTTGTVSSANSLVGTQASDKVGVQGITVLNNSNYVVNSFYWKNGSLGSAGAVTWGNGTSGVSGAVSSTNSLVGSSANDQVGSGGVYSEGITAFENGNYVIKTNNWSNGSVKNVGAITPVNGATGLSGPVTSCNSSVGSTQYAGFYRAYSYDVNTNKLLVASTYPKAVSLFSPLLTTPATTTSSATNTASGTNNVSFVNNTSCTLLASLVPSGTAPASGVINASVNVAGTAPTNNGTVYVRRSYDITPAAGGNTSTATITLYFTQADFDDYNTNNGADPDLPTGPNDAAGKANVRINQQHGTSGTNTFGTYTGWGGSGPANVIITPGANNVVWNAGLFRWEVTFDVTGFSGFFITGNAPVPTPIHLLDFTANAQSNRNRLDWNTATETEGTTFEIQRSADGSAFEKIGALTSGKSVYVFYDEAPLAGRSYYRIQSVEISGEKTLSKIAVVQRNGGAGGVSVAPVPAGNTVTITNSNAQLAGSVVTALDMQGRVMDTMVLETASTTLEVQNWPVGVYMLKFSDGSVLKVVKQ